MPLDGPPSISLLTANTPSRLVILRENAQLGQRSEIYVSSDGGRTAQRVPILDTKFYALFPYVTPLAGNELGLLNGSTLLLSTDGGRTWHQQGHL